MTHHDDNVPEPTEDDEHFVHMHIDFNEGAVTDENGVEKQLGIVHMHIHGVPQGAFVDTLLSLATSITGNAMAQSDDSPVSNMPAGEARDKAANSLARMWLAARLMSAQSEANEIIQTQIPNDASSLLD